MAQVDEVHIIAYDMQKFPVDSRVSPPHILLQSALSNFEWDQTEHENKPIYGNRQGIGLLQSCDNLKERMTNLEETVTGLRAEVTSLREMVTEQQVDIDHLCPASKGYQLIRHRFLDCYRRDRLGHDSEDMHASIRAANKAAPSADAVTDAVLYSKGGRDDVDTFLHLYGLGPEKVLTLNHRGCKYIIKVLECVAMLEVDQAIALAVKEAFRDFIQVIDSTEDSDIPSDVDSLSPLGRAYHTVWNSINASRMNE